MENLEIAGHVYRTTGKLNAFTQLHVTRRLAPVLPAYALLREKAAGRPLTITDLIASPLAPVLAMFLAKMPEEDVNYVFNACLDVCRRLDNEQWMRLRTPGAVDSLQYADIDAAVMTRLTTEVLQENLGGFFPIAPSTSPASAPLPSKD